MRGLLKTDARNGMCLLPQLLETEFNMLLPSMSSINHTEATLKETYIEIPTELFPEWKIKNKTTQASSGPLLDHFAKLVRRIRWNRGPYLAMGVPASGDLKNRKYVTK